jgi:hypothetical protein
MIFRLITLLGLFFSLISCVTYYDRVEFDKSGIANAKQCCPSINQLPKAIDFNGRYDGWLKPDNDHFNFGLGLSPFLHLNVDESMLGKKIAVLTTSHTTGLAVGGELGLRYIEPQIYFLDSDGNFLDLEEYYYNIELLEGDYMYGIKTIIPNLTASMVIASAQAYAGQERFTSEVLASRVNAVNGIYFPTPTSKGTVKYSSHIYGDVKVRVY